MGHLVLPVHQGNNWVRQVGQPVKDAKRDAFVLQVGLCSDETLFTGATDTEIQIKRVPERKSFLAGKTKHKDRQDIAAAGNVTRVLFFLCR